MFWKANIIILYIVCQFFIMFFVVMEIIFELKDNSNLQMMINKMYLTSKRLLTKQIS